MNVRYSLLLILLALLTNTGVAQEERAAFALRSDTSILSFTVVHNVGNQPLKVSGSGGLDLFKLDDTDLRYTFSPPRSKRHFRHDYSGYLLSEGDAVNAEIIHDQDSVVMLWYDATELGLYPDLSYQLFRITTLYGDVNCSEQPPFYQPRFRRIAIVGAGLGAATVLYGFVEGADGDAAYNQYLNEWRGGATEQDAAPFFEEASDGKSRQRILQGVGGGMILMAGVYMIGELLKHKRQTRTYREHCTGTSTDPALSIAPTTAPGYLAPGVVVTLKIR